MQIVRFECGCIGTEPVDGKSHILQCCDGDGPVPARNVQGKKWSPVDSWFAEDLLEAFQDHVKLKALKEALTSLT